VRDALLCPNGLGHSEINFLLTTWHTLPEIEMDCNSSSTSPGFSYRFRLKFLFLGILLLFLAPLSSWVRSEKDPRGDRQKEPRCRQPSGSDHSGIQKITFVHVSDMHARYNPDKNGSSPAGRIRGYYQQVKKENPFTLFTNAGDDYEKGSVAEELSRGQSTREVVEAMQYDVRALGNHDFAWGIEELLRFSHDPSAIVLASNTTLKPGAEWPFRSAAPGWTDFAIKTVGCVKIGFFGLLSRPWNEKDQQYEGLFYPSIPELQTDFRFIDRAKDIIAKHRQEVDVLVLVSHLGLPDDIALGEKTTGIDLILGGHSHATTEVPLHVNNTTILHVGAFGQTIGRYDIEYDVKHKSIVDSSFELVANSPRDMPEDLATSNMISGILKKYKSEMNEIITEVSRDQNRQDMALIAARAAVATLKTDAALINIGTVGPEWLRGQLSRQDILDSFKVERQPAGTSGQNSLYVVTVMGTDLLYAAATRVDSIYYGPTSLNPTASYTIAIQKAQATNQQELLGRTIGITSPQQAAELWETVAAYAQDCRMEGLALDEGLHNWKTGNLIALLQGEEIMPISVRM